MIVPHIDAGDLVVRKKRVQSNTPHFTHTHIPLQAFTRKRMYVDTRTPYAYTYTGREGRDSERASQAHQAQIFPFRSSLPCTAHYEGSI